MEATPSLACANKCVFCWRHHTNPVGKSWQWKMDDPLEIVNAAIDQHTKMIKQMKGVPGGFNGSGALQMCLSAHDGAKMHLLRNLSNYMYKY